MKGETADKLYAICKDLVTDTDGNADDLYNILEGYALQYLDDLEAAE